MNTDKNSGIIARLSDNRLVIIYNKRPLLSEKGFVILHLVDENYNLIKENNKPKTLLKRVDIYNEEMQAAKLIGYVD